MKPIELLPYLVPYIVSATISLSVSGLCWRRRKVKGAGAYAILALGQASWTIGYIFELISSTLQGKLFWDNFQSIGVSVWTIWFLLFVLDYTEVKLPKPRLILPALFFPSVVLPILSFTDPLHGLIRGTSSLIPGTPFAELTYPFTSLYLAFGIYIYITFFAGLLVLLVRQGGPARLFRTQAGLVVLGNLIPTVGTMFTLAGISLSFHRDFSPLTFAIGNVIVFISLFRFRLFDIRPIARTRVVEGLRDSVVVIDNQRRIVDMNPAGKESIRHLIDDPIGKSLDEVYAAWPDLVERFKGIGAITTEIEADVLSEVRYYEVTVDVVLDWIGSPAGQIVVSRDITDRKRAEQELKKRSEELEAANEELRVLTRLKDEFVSNVSHELRSPLASLKIYNHLIQQSIKDEDQIRRLASMRRDTDRLESIIEGLLLLSRGDQNRITLKTTPFDINRLVEEMVTDRVVLAQQRKLSLAFQPEDTQPTASGDPMLLSQVLSILLTNAMHYTPAGGSIQVSVEHRNRDGHWAGFSVKDSGPGISPEEQQKLFTRFFRGEAGRKSSEAGTGLGLAIAREIVDRHHGHIEIESSGVPGEGTTFRVWLPVADQAG